MFFPALVLLAILPLVNSSFPVTHGVGAGEATTTTVVLWSRTNAAGAYMHVILIPESGSPKRRFVSSKQTSSDSDYSMRMTVSGLTPNTAYIYRICFSALKTPSCNGRNKGRGKFRTAAPEHVKSPVKIVWSGDLAGQDVCRDVKLGFPIFRPMSKEDPDVIVLSGDMIYADNLCSEIGLYGNKQIVGDFNQSTNIEDFRKHWAYNRDDHLYRKFLQSAQALVAWDDHEIVNDAGPSHDSRPNIAAGDFEEEPPYIFGLKLTPLALQAMYEWNPFSATTLRPRHYGSYRYGKHVEIFRLDTRLYRDANLLNDSDIFPKTLLGIEQKMWLKTAVKESDATWKIIQSSVPISIPTGSIKNGRDGWSNGDSSSDGPNSATEGGFERELLEIVEAFKEANVKNTVWITADVHFAEVFKYPSWAPNFWEVVVGPLNAGLFPKEEFDHNLGGVKRLFGPYGPPSFEEGLETGYKGVLKYMNYGVLDIDSEGTMRISIKNVKGVPIYEKQISGAVDVAHDIKSVSLPPNMHSYTENETESKYIMFAEFSERENHFMPTTVLFTLQF